MKQTLTILALAFLITACSIQEPRVAFGKKCEVHDGKITYSYVWLYEKKSGLPATADQCKALEEVKEVKKK